MDKKNSQLLLLICYCYCLTITTLVHCIHSMNFFLFLLQQDGISDVFRFVTFCVELSLFIVQLILVLVLEPKSPYDTIREGEVSRYHSWYLLLCYNLLFVLVQRKPCPEDSVSFFSRITWWWQNRFDEQQEPNIINHFLTIFFPLSDLFSIVYSLFLRGYKRALTYDDLCDINNEEKSHMVAPKFQKQWDMQLRKAGSVSIFN